MAKDVQQWLLDTCIEERVRKDQKNALKKKNTEKRVLKRTNNISTSFNGNNSN